MFPLGGRADATGRPDWDRDGIGEPRQRVTVPTAPQAHPDGHQDVAWGQSPSKGCGSVRHSVFDVRYSTFASSPPPPGAVDCRGSHGNRGPRGRAHKGTPAGKRHEHPRHQQTRAPPRPPHPARALRPGQKHELDTQMQWTSVTHAERRNQRPSYPSI